MPAMYWSSNRDGGPYRSKQCSLEWMLSYAGKAVISGEKMITYSNVGPGRRGKAALRRGDPIQGLFLWRSRTSSRVQDFSLREGESRAPRSWAGIDKIAHHLGKGRRENGWDPRLWMQSEIELFCCGPCRSLAIKSFTANASTNVCRFFWNLRGLTVQVATVLWASPQVAWLEREDRRHRWATVHTRVHTQGWESHVFTCASHSKGQNQVCVWPQASHNSPP